MSEIRRQPDRNINLYTNYRSHASCENYAGSHPLGSHERPPLASAWPIPHQQAQEEIPQRPLQVIHVSTAMTASGIDNWLTALIRHADPRYLKFTRCIVTSNSVDYKQVLRVGVPVEIGGAESVRRAAGECDVLLVSDPGEHPSWIGEVDPRLCVIVAHGDGEWTRQRLEWMRPIVHHVIAVSRGVREAVCNEFDTTIIPNGVDSSHITRSRPRPQVRSRFGFAEQDFVLGFVGRFSLEKNPFALIEAVSLLPARFKALLVGFGHLREELLDRANHLIPGRYALTCGDEHLGDLYHAMDAFCLPSYTEGYGLAIMEAMMCGRPVIVTPVGLAPDAIVNRVNGLVVTGEPASIAAAASLLEQHPDWAASVGREAARYADLHGHASLMARGYEQLLWRLYRQRSASAI